MVVLFDIHEREAIPSTKAPSRGIPDAVEGTGRGSSNAARRAHIGLKSSLCTQWGVRKTRKMKKPFEVSIKVPSFA